ncbi:MAG: hypothetical protein KAX65_15955, partial [Caldilineaceae bacterium]|nr:hypothetical protein [Caldilineaceae bacterium]
MNIEQSIARTLPINRGRSWGLRRLLRLVEFVVILAAAIGLLGRSAVDVNGATWMTINNQVNGWGWDLVGWEAAAIASKVRAGISQPVQHLDAAARAEVVRDYAARSQRIGEVEGRINGLAAASGSQITPEIADLQT